MTEEIRRTKARDKLLRIAVRAYIEKHPETPYGEIAREIGCSASFASRVGLAMGHAPRPAGRPPAKPQPDKAAGPS